MLKMSHHFNGFILAMTLMIIAPDFIRGQEAKGIPLLEPGNFVFQADFSLNPAIRPGPEGEMVVEAVISMLLDVYNL